MKADDWTCAKMHELSFRGFKRRVDITPNATVLASHPLEVIGSWVGNRKIYAVSVTLQARVCRIQTFEWKPY